METLIVKKASKKKLDMFLNYAEQLGIEILVSPKKSAVKKESEKDKQTRIVKGINQNITKRLLALHNLSL